MRSLLSGLVSTKPSTDQRPRRWQAIPPLTTHQPSETLAREILVGWLKANRNYFVVVPPLNRAELLFQPLRDHALAQSAHGDESHKLAIAFCPHGLIGDANGLVRRACEHWKITPPPDRSYQWQLEDAVTKLSGYAIDSCDVST